MLSYDINFKKFGTTIRDARHEKCLSQDNVCEKLDISKPYLSRIENGNENPRLHNIIKLCNFYCLSPHISLTEIYSPYIIPLEIKDKIRKLSPIDVMNIADILSYSINKIGVQYTVTDVCSQIDLYKMSKRIKFLCEQRKLSSKSISNLASLSDGGYANIESGNKSPSLQTIFLIAKALDCPIDYLLVDSLENKNFAIEYIFNQFNFDSNNRVSKYTKKILDVLVEQYNV